MPIKITTETDLVRVLSNTPLQLDLTFMKIKSHTSKNTPIEHMRAFYKDFEVLRHEKFDGMIITGAPVEHLDFEEVNYWGEMQDIFAWARTHVTSTLYICWAAQAGLYYHYGVPKHPLSAKMFGIFPQKPLDPLLPIFRGFDDVFMMPHSRHTEIRREDIEAVEGLTIIAESEESGVSIVMARGGREFFITGHAEYSPLTLDTEYRRDLAKGLPIDMPRHYYRNDDPDLGPLVTWRAHANLLFTNWLNYYVYQETPYDIEAIHCKKTNNKHRTPPAPPPPPPHPSPETPPSTPPQAPPGPLPPPPPPWGGGGEERALIRAAHSHPAPGSVAGGPSAGASVPSLPLRFHRNNSLPPLPSPPPLTCPSPLTPPPSTLNAHPLTPAPSPITPSPLTPPPPQPSTLNPHPLNR